MLLRLSRLRCKEVINLCDGARLGYVSDLELEVPDGVVRCLIVPVAGRFFGLLGSPGDYVIPWNCVRQVGGDLILVEASLEQCRRPKEKRGGFF